MKIKLQVTPGVLQLVSHSKVLAEMVNLHFLSLMEALMECHSTILVKLMPLWTPVLFAYQVLYQPFTGMAKMVGISCVNPVFTQPQHIPDRFTISVQIKLHGNSVDWFYITHHHSRLSCRTTCACVSRRSPT